MKWVRGIRQWPAIAAVMACLAGVLAWWRTQAGQPSMVVHLVPAKGVKSGHTAWSLHFRRPGTEHMDAVLVCAEDPDEAMSLGLQQMAKQHPDVDPQKPGQDVHFASIARLD